MVDTRLLRAVALFGIAAPLLVLVALYGASRLVVAVAFGDLLFGVTILTAATWLLFAGSGRRLDAARPESELARNSASDYGSELSRGSYAALSRSGGVLVVLTGTVVLGWIAVIVG